jgi:hypothetical protein
MLAAEKTSSIRERVITVECPPFIRQEASDFSGFIHYTSDGTGRTLKESTKDVLLWFFILIETPQGLYIRQRGVTSEEEGGCSSSVYT